MKKQRNKDSNNFPFANETKRMKHEFIKMIQSMPDDAFESFIILFLDYLDYIDSFDDDLEEYFYDGEDEIFEIETKSLAISSFSPNLEIKNHHSIKNQIY